MSCARLQCRQQCNQCIAMTLACRYAHSANARLERTRQRWLDAQRAKALEAVRLKIARLVAARPPAVPVPATAVPASSGRAAVSNQARSRQAQHMQREPTTEEKKIAQLKRTREDEIPHAPAKSPLAKRQQEDKGAEAGAEAAPGKDARAQATSKETSFQYVCPTCQKSVTTNIQTGEVDQRRACGHRFRVRNGHVVAKAYAYACRDYGQQREDRDRRPSNGLREPVRCEGRRCATKSLCLRLS